MADRYWVGGTGLWSSTNTANWSSDPSSSRVGGASVPTQSDNVYFDQYSGSGTVTLNSAAGSSTRNCYNLDMTGFTGTLTTSQASVSLDVYGTSIILSNTGTFDSANYPTLKLRSGTTTTILTRGQTVGNLTILDNSTLVLQDNLIGHNNTQLYLDYGVFTANGKDVAMGYFNDNNSTNAKTVNMGSGTWNMLGSGPVEYTQVSATVSRGPGQAWVIQQPAYFTLNKGTSKLRFLKAGDAAGLDVALTNSPSETSVVIHESSGWPSSGRVLIDNEEIEYSALSNNTLTISKRGANGTQLAAHAEDSAVILLYDTKTTLTTAINDGTSTSDIVVASTTGFPTAGTLLIDGEIIQYFSTTSTNFGSNIFNSVTYTLTRGLASGGIGTAHSIGAVVRHAEAREFWGGGKDYNVIDFYNAGGYFSTNCLGGFTASVIQSGGVLGIQNIYFDAFDIYGTGPCTYSTTDFYLKGTNQQPIYCNTAPWSANTARQYNVEYYSTGNPGTNSLMPYIDRKIHDFFDVIS